MNYAIFSDPTQKYRIVEPSLIGVKDNWKIPMKLLKLKLPQYLTLISEQYNGKYHIYRNKDGNIKFVGIYWDDKHINDAKKFVNLLNNKML